MSNPGVARKAHKSNSYLKYGFTLKGTAVFTFHKDTKSSGTVFKEVYQ